MSPGTPQATCRHCAAPLAAPQRHSGICGAAGCRHRDDRARWARLTQQLGPPALDEARARPGGAGAVLLWLRDAESRTVPVPARVRQAHRAFLQGLVDAPPDAAERPLAPVAAEAASGEQAGRLCAQCRGRCCSQGGPRHAFITRPQLLRWQQREAGRSLQDAADWYMAQVPARHVRRACIYQGPRGCVLPRDDRADICNAYACDPLVQVQQTVQDAPQAAFVAITLDGDRPLRRALITGRGTSRL